MAKFIINEEMELYTSHGCIKAKDVYKIYSENYNRLPSDFVIAGTFRGKEFRTGIKYMEDFISNDYCEIEVSGKRIITDKLIVYPKQEFFTPEATKVKTKDIKVADTKVVSLNGMLSISSVSFAEEPTKFIYFETMNEFMPSIYATNMLLLPIDNAEEELPFFIKE